MAKMDAISKTYLQTTNFHFLENWSVQYLLESPFTYNEDFKLVKIGNFLIRNKMSVVVDENKTYKRVTIKTNNGGVFLRDTEIGTNIGTKKQFKIRVGQFLISKIDARNGAIGIVPKEVDNAIITGNFWTFDIDNSVINPYFLVLITTTSEFIRFCENASNGTTNRHYLQEDLFLAQQIPLPTLKEQNRIVEVYNKKIILAKEQENKAKELEKGIEGYLIDVLGIKQIKKLDNRKGLQFVSLKNTTRWDTLFLLGNIPMLESKYPIKSFSNVIKSFNERDNGDSLRINSKYYPEDEFNYIGMENIEKETGRLLGLDKVKGKDIKSQTLKVPGNFFLYGKLRPYLNKYWINETEKVNIICSSEFFVFEISNLVEKYYFKYILSSFIIQSQITDKTSGARMPRINEQIFYNLQFPLPSMEVQCKIAKTITQIKTEIKELKTLAESNRKMAIKEFENEIFKPCN